MLYNIPYMAYASSIMASKELRAGRRRAPYTLRGHHTCSLEALSVESRAALAPSHIEKPSKRDVEWLKRLDSRA